MLTPHPATGFAVPLGLHWCLAPRMAPVAQLGQDGHPVIGNFLPPVGSVARIVRDPLCASVVLVAGHEQTHTCDLLHDELALLSRYFGAIGSSPMARAALKQRGALLIWFDPETIWLAGPSGKRGRPATVSDAAIQACLTLKALFGLPLRQTTGLVASLLALAASLLALAGRDWAVPDFSTLSRGPSGLSIAIRYRPSTGALHILIDIEPASATGSGEPARDAARTSEPDPRWPAYRQGWRRRCL